MCVLVCVFVHYIDGLCAHTSISGFQAGPNSRLNLLMSVWFIIRQTLWGWEALWLRSPSCNGQSELSMELHAHSHCIDIMAALILLKWQSLFSGNHDQDVRFKNLKQYFLFFGSFAHHVNKFLFCDLFVKNHCRLLYYLLLYLWEYGLLYSAIRLIQLAFYW